MKNTKGKLKFLFGLLMLVACIFLIFYSTKPQASADNLNIYFLDIGQGDASYIKLPSGQDILIDGGPDNSVLTELGKVMSFGDREIDLVILSHPHADHITGLLEVVKRYKVNEIWETGAEYPSATYASWKEEIKSQNIPDKYVSAGDEKIFDFVKIKVLYPPSSLENKTIDNINDASVVGRLEYDKFTVLFTGDAEKEIQDELLKSDESNNLYATVLKVAHHGSTNGLTEDFLKVVRPAVAIISVGKDNKYGHPSANTTNLLKKYATQIYRTDQNGSIEISFDGESYHIKTNL